MLLQLIIRDFVIVDHLTVDFARGMSTITGETGAGKSIAIDALGLCLGQRGDAAMIRQGAQRTDISTRFSVQDTPSALAWLKENQLDDHDECILRRVISRDGRSKGFINGTPVPLSQLRALGQMLIQIHGQHTHQMLLKPEYQRVLLDNYRHQPALDAQMKAHYQQWQQADKQLKAYQQAQAERESRSQLLQYQLNELDEFAPMDGEFELMEAEYKRLSNMGEIISLSQNAATVLTESDDYNALSLLHHARQQIESLVEMDTHFVDLLAMLEEAAIQVNELSVELRHYAEQCDMDDGRAFELEQRIAKQIALARKHHVPAAQLPALHAQLQAEFDAIGQANDTLAELHIQVAQFHQQAMATAQLLHDERTTFAHTLATQITERIRDLAMPEADCVIEVQFDASHLSQDGADKVDLRVKTNVGQPLQPLAKVVSGGELSRIALAVQVITAKQTETPALIFDEVDVGISGQTASKVGQQLRQLGESTQVICVTHLPQVAGNAHQQFFVTKASNAQETTTSMLLLDKEGRLKELARLLGGDKITKNTLANAKELLIE